MNRGVFVADAGMRDGGNVWWNYFEFSVQQVGEVG